MDLHVYKNVLAAKRGLARGDKLQLTKRAALRLETGNEADAVLRADFSQSSYRSGSLTQTELKALKAKLP